VLSERLPCLLQWRPNLERAVSALAEDRLPESNVEVGEPPAGRHQLADCLPRCFFLVSSINSFLSLVLTRSTRMCWHACGQLRCPHQLVVRWARPRRLRVQRSPAARQKICGLLPVDGLPSGGQGCRCRDDHQAAGFVIVPRASWPAPEQTAELHYVVAGALTHRTPAGIISAPT
jgi:hypothetical protein